MPTKTLDRTYKTKSLAISAAHKALGADAIEGLDFLVRNTGAGWEFEAVAHGTVGERAEKLVETPTPRKTVPKPKTRASKPEPTPAVAKPRTPRGKPPAAAPAPKPEPVEAKVDKRSIVIGLLKRAEGVSAPEAGLAIGWQVHSVRALITATIGRKLGHKITAGREEGRGMVYRISAG